MKTRIARRWLAVIMAVVLLLGTTYLGVSAVTAESTTTLEVSWSRSSEPIGGGTVVVTADKQKWDASGSTLGEVEIDDRDYDFRSYNDEYWILKRQSNNNYYFSKKSAGTSTRPSTKKSDRVSSYYNTTAGVDGTMLTDVPHAAWDWATAGAIETPVTAEDRIWDASSDDPYYTDYTSGTDYKAATWELKTSDADGNRGNADLRRFTGTFTLPANFDPTDTIQYRSVNQEAYSEINDGNIIPINDDVYIFCYPESIQDQISNDPNSPYYYLNYLVFWSGTSQQYEGKTFHGIASNTAIHANTNYSPYKGLTLTDGWYVEADPDNIGEALFQSGVIPAANETYVLDVFTDDYAGGGGMDQPEIVVRRSNNLRVVANDDSYTASTQAPAALSILTNDQVYRRSEPVTNVGLTASNFVSYGDTVLARQGSGYAVTVGGTQAGTLTVGADGTGTFTPVQSFVGTMQFMYTASADDNGTTRSDTAVVTITVQDMDMSDLLHVGKTAQLVSWDDRTYDLTLTAWSDGSSSTTTTQIPADVVLVIDRSGSMLFPGGDAITTANSLGKLDTSKTYAAYYNYYGSLEEINIRYRNGAWRWNWYGDSIGNNSYRVSDYASGIGSIYETRMTLLKAATAEFINALPEGSSIAITSFSSSRSHSTDYSRTIIEGTAAQQQAVKDAAIAAVNAITPNGSTFLSGGLSEANAQLPADGRNSVVIAFTDGENDSSDQSVTTQAAAIRAKAKLFTIGMGEADNDFLSTICSPTTENDPTVYNRPCENMANLAASLLNILSDTTTSGGFTGVTVTDTIDPRFVVVGEDGQLLGNGDTVGDGGVLYIDAAGNQKVVWSNQTVAYDKDHPGQPTWSQTIRVQAKDAFIGGNNVPTNGADSQVEAGDVTKPFPQPTVNVQVRFTVTDDSDTIFLGETVPGTTLNVNAGSDPFCGMAATGTFAYQWKDAGGQVLEDYTSPTFPSDSGIVPQDDTHFTLTVTFTPTASTAGDASSTLDSTVYNASNAAQNTLAQDGTYTITVLTGTLTLTKTLTADTPADTVTPFVFRVDRYDTQGALQETFYRTVYTSTDKTGSLTITGLPQGAYVVTEQVNWSWRYEAVGELTQSGTLGLAADYSDDEMEAGFTNKKVNNQWAGGSDSVINLFTK